MPMKMPMPQPDRGTRYQMAKAKQVQAMRAQAAKPPHPATAGSLKGATPKTGKAAKMAGFAKRRYRSY